MSDYSHPFDFFKALIDEIIDLLDDYDIDIPSRLQEYYNQLNTENDIDSVIRFFKKAKRLLPYRIVIIIDEFDKAISLFKYESKYYTTPICQDNNL